VTQAPAKFPRAKPHRLSPPEVKALVRHRDGYRCQECGMTARQHVRRYRRTLDVHRIVPGSPYTVDGCMTICRRCHGDKPKAAPGVTSDRPYYAMSLRGPVAEAVRRYAVENDLPISTVMKRALKEFLTSEGLWPPPRP
jgi:predicted amidophosphoribosyltransferase